MFINTPTQKVLTHYTESDTINTDRIRKERKMVGKHIKTFREDLGITQKELANRLGVTQPTVGNWEAGIREPRTKQLLKIAQELGVSVADLLGEKP